MDQQRKAEIGARIKELREASSYRQPWVAERVGVTLRAYQKWEAGGGTEYENYERLADIFGVSVDYILRGEAPNLMGALDGGGDDSQLDRIEAMLTQLVAGQAAGIEAMAELAEAVGALQRQAQPQRRAAS